MKVMTIEDLFNAELLDETPELMESVIRFNNTEVGKLHNENEMEQWLKTRMSHSPFLFDLVQRRMEIEKEIDKKAIKFLENHPEIESKPENYLEFLKYVAAAHRKIREDLNIDKNRYMIAFDPEQPEKDDLLFSCIEKYINYRMVEIPYVFELGGATTYKDMNKLFNSKNDLSKALDSIDLDRLIKVSEMLDKDEEGATEAADALLEEVLGKMGGSDDSNKDIVDRLKDVFGDVDIERGEVTSIGDNHIEQDLTVNGEVIGRVLAVDKNSDFGEKLERLIKEHSDDSLDKSKIN